MRLFRGKLSYGIAIAAVLGLGIGCLATQVTVIHTLWGHFLPFADADRLVSISLRHDLGLGADAHPDAGGSVRFGDYIDLAAEQQTCSAVTAYFPGAFPIQINGTWHRLTGTAVTPNFFSLLGVRPAQGRGFDDDAEGADGIVISHRMWREFFNGDPDVLSRHLRVGDSTRSVVGVMPERFRFPRAEHFWIPLNQLEGTDDDVRPMSPAVAVIGRLRSDATAAMARTEIQLIARRLAAAYPESNEAVTKVEVKPLAEAFISPSFRQVMLAMLAATIVFFLVAVSNAANLQLARSLRLRRETAIRSALGATRTHLVRDVLFDWLTLGAIGTLIGFLISSWGLRVVRLVVTSDVRGSGVAPPWLELHYDPLVLGLTACMILLAMLAVGLGPALQASRADIGLLLRDAGRGNVAGRTGRVARWLVIGQVAATCPLLFGALVLARSLVQQENFDWGFPVEQLVTNRVSLRGERYPGTEERRRFQIQLLSNLRNDPRVSHAALVNRGPSLYQARASSAYEVHGYPPTDRLPQVLMLEYISLGFFETVQLPIILGRDLNLAEISSGNRVAIVNQSFGGRHFGSADPIGKRFRLVSPDGDPGEWTTIVGVVPDISILGPAARVPKNVPSAFVPICGLTHTPPEISIVLRGPVSPEVLARTLAEHVSHLDPDLTLYGATIGPQLHLAEVLRPRRNLTLVFAGFAVMSVLLAAAGLFGVVMYSVQERAPEMGVRMALGAARRQIVAQVMGDVARQMVVGGGVGLALTVLLGWAVRDYASRILYEVSTLNPWLLACTLGVLVLAALVAALGPTVRASRVDPAVALRQE